MSRTFIVLFLVVSGSTVLRADEGRSPAPDPDAWMYHSSSYPDGVLPTWIDAGDSNIAGMGPTAACCVGSDCVLTDALDCTKQGGHFVEAAVFCAPSVCATGACCDAPNCVDDDGVDGAMDEALCDQRGGTYLGGASCDAIDPCGFFRIPEGFEVVDVSPGTELHARRHPRINNCGEIVFHFGDMGASSSGGTAEVYRYDNGLLTRLTDNDESDAFPGINDDGTMTWTVGFNGGGGGEVVLYRDGVLTTLGDGDSSAINNRDHVVWMLFSPAPPAFGSTIMFYDGVATNVLFNDGLSNQSPRLNDSDLAVWKRVDFTGDGSGNWTSDIMRLEGGKAQALASISTQPQSPDADNTGRVAWGSASAMEMWQEGQSAILVLGRGRIPSLNNRGEIAFHFRTLPTPWQIWIHDSDTFTRVSPDEDIPDLIDNGRPALNDAGEIAWWRLPNGALSPSWTMFMRRIRTGDVDLDNDVDRADFAYFPDCYTGSVPTDRLCECRFLDIDHDRDVDDDDFTLFMQNYTGPLDDCNGNGTLDFEDILHAETPDCNQNGIPDSCDLSGGTSLDADGDGVVDDFAAKKVKTPWLEIFPTWTNRYLHMIPRNQGIESAIRVTLVEVNGFGEFNGQVRWVGPPAEYPEEDSSDPQRTFSAAPLQCEPHFMDWSIVDDLYVFGAEIVPGSSYENQEIGMGCAVNLDDQSAYSEFPVTIRTATWGDVTEPFATTEGAAAQPDFTDVAALVNKFTADPAGLNKSFTQLQPNTPDPSQPITFSDIAVVVDAFTGSPYPFAGPTECP